MDVKDAGFAGVKNLSKNHNLVLFGLPELLRTLSMLNNQDIKSRITYSATLKRLNDEDLSDFIHQQLTKA